MRAAAVRRSPRCCPWRRRPAVRTEVQVGDSAGEGRQRRGRDVDPALDQSQAELLGVGRMGQAELDSAADQGAEQGVEVVVLALHEGKPSGRVVDRERGEKRAQ